MPKIFVSHAVRDKKIVDNFIDLLQSGMNVNYNDIYCTSHGKIKNGESFVEDIRDNLVASNLVFLLLTNNFFVSKFCLNEMGATWALGTPFVPVIVPPVSFAKLEDTCLKGVQALRINVKADLILLFEELINREFIPKAPYSRFEAKANDFIRKKPWETLSINPFLS